MSQCDVLAHRSVVTSRNIMHHTPSKLCVTFLQLGHWVLFDNVNFCSPSVRFAARHPSQHHNHPSTKLTGFP